MMTPSQVPFYVEAPSKDALIQAMIAINAGKAFHNFFDIQKDGANWVAWYYVDTGELAKRKINGATSNN